MTTTDSVATEHPRQCQCLGSGWVHRRDEQGTYLEECLTKKPEVGEAEAGDGYGR